MIATSQAKNAIEAANAQESSAEADRKAKQR
jgi:hypothetical protein